MKPPKTLRERERELQHLLATEDGRREIEALAARYFEEGGKVKPPRRSAITYILVHERDRGLITD